MNDRKSAGPFNSSVTRVWPVFSELLERDPSGCSWLPPILSATAKFGRHGPALATLDCKIDPSLREKRQFTRYQIPVSLPNCLEYVAAAPERFLSWLIRNPSRLNWSRSTGPAENETARQRARLKAGDEGAIREALDQLAIRGSTQSEGRWWAFEGPTSIDCYFETSDFGRAIEGKRTETLSVGTSWYSERNQLARNLEVVQTLARGRRYGLLLLVEEAEQFSHITPENAGDYLRPALPHFDEAECCFLAKHFLGVLSWREVCRVTSLPFEQLPNTIDDYFGKIPR